jgi:hypothetical protein
MPLFSCYARAGLNAPFSVAFSFRWAFSMEASVCLPCGVSQDWSGLAPWQWRRRCSRSGRALRALLSRSGVQGRRGVPVICPSPPYRGDRSVIVRGQANAVPRLKRAMRLPFAYTDYRRACPAQLLPSACSSRHFADGGRTVSSDPAFCLQPSTRRTLAVQG